MPANPEFQAGRAITSLPLPPALVRALLQCGISSTADLLQMSPLDLQREAGISHGEAMDVLLHLPTFSSGYSQALVGAKSARQLLQEEETERLGRISTECAQLDAILGGGIPPCQLTEICGAPGVGKTQLCMQLALSVQVPQALGGAGGQAVYIDSEGSFLPDRAVQMAESLLRRYTGPCSSNREGSTDRPSGPLSVCNARSAEERPVNPARQGHLDAGHVFAAGAVGQAATTSLPPAAAMERLPEGTPPSPLDAAGAGGATEALQEGRQAPVGDALSSCAAPCKDQPAQTAREGEPECDRWHAGPSELLQNVHFFRVLSWAEQLAVCNMLPSFLEEHPQVRLVVLDSVTFQFRQAFPDIFQRTRTLLTFGQHLLSIAQTYKVAIVLSNHVQTRMMDGAAHLAPALGEGWSHTSTNRLILFWKDQQRFAHILKSPYLPPATAHFSVTCEGIRGGEWGENEEGLALDQDAAGAKRLKA